MKKSLRITLILLLVLSVATLCFACGNKDKIEPGTGFEAPGDSKKPMKLSAGTTAFDIEEMVEKGEITSLTIQVVYDSGDGDKMIETEKLIISDSVSVILSEYTTEDENGDTYGESYCSIADITNVIFYELHGEIEKGVLTLDSADKSPTLDSEPDVEEWIAVFKEDVSYYMPDEDVELTIIDNGGKYTGSEGEIISFTDINATNIVLPEAFRNYEQKAVWSEYVDGNGVEYRIADYENYDKYEAEIYFGNAAEVTVADNVDGKPVTRISYNFVNSTIVTLNLPASITEIPKGAFTNRESLKTINFAGTRAAWEAFELGELQGVTVNCADD